MTVFEGKLVSENVKVGIVASRLADRYGVPAIVAMGRKGGSNVAAAICNALVYSAGEMLDPSARGWQG